jgi:hypothetical protein
MTTEYEATTAEEACFEAGVKFGSLYHQFAGTPISPDSAASLETAVEKAIENQPHCESVTVEMKSEAIAAATPPGVSYTELTGTLMNVEMVVEYEGVRVRTRMETEDGYPLMRVVSVDSGDDERT